MRCPTDFYRSYGVRRYGFHGTSHQYVAGEAARHLGRPPATLNLITLHLGNGASAAAIERGKSIDTSMGLTPLEGLVMGTRCGDLDPAVHFYLARKTGRPFEEIEDVLNKESGLKGICGVNDMREIQNRAQGGDEQAELALEMFCYRVKKYIGAYYAALGSVDAIVFTGGIGENSAACAQQILRGTLSPRNYLSMSAANNEDAGGITRDTGRGGQGEDTCRTDRRGTRDCTTDRRNDQKSERSGTMTDVRSYSVEETLKNGTAVRIRGVRADDKKRISEAFRNLETESIYKRFFQYKKALTDEELKAATEVDFENEVALVVTIGEKETETIIGAGRYVAFDAAGGQRNAEVAFMVEEDYQGLGIAGITLRHLAGIAKDKGIAAVSCRGSTGKRGDAGRVQTERLPDETRIRRRCRACNAVTQGRTLRSMSLP